MLSRDTMALVEMDSATLELCKIVEESDGGAPSLCTLVRLGLPPLAPRTCVFFESHCIRESVSAYSNAPSLVIEGRPPRRVPFHTSTEEGLVAVIMHIGRDSWPYNTRYLTIVTHLRALVALTTRTSPGETFIPWENWGPRITACFDDEPFHPCALMGERLTIISNEGLSLLDFNLSRIRDTIQRTGNSSGPSGPVTTVNHRSVIPRRRTWFREDVIGELPYISVRVVRPDSSDRTHPANYEEGLAVLSWDVRGRRFSPSSVAFRH
jgi:hypothetical protein